MKLIPLSQGKFAKVDDADFEWLSQWRWNAHKEGKTYYAIRQIRTGKRPPPTRPAVRMHREILGLKHGDGITGDHKNGDGLDNRRSNLRKCTKSQNTMNSDRKKGKYGFRGIDKTPHGKFNARIWIDGKKKHLGAFSTASEAGECYKKAAKKIFGDFYRNQ